MKKQYSYVGITFVILIFGYWVIKESVDRFKKNPLHTFEEVPSFSFKNEKGQWLTNKDLLGKVYVLDFFFTSCPSICPVMTNNLKLVENVFQSNPNFAIISITIDPKRDQMETLSDYKESHAITMKNWHFLTGKQEDIYQFSNEGFKLYAGENESAAGGFEHSGLFALVDKKGFIRSRTVKVGDFENPIKFYDGTNLEDVQKIKEDIKILLEE